MNNPTKLFIVEGEERDYRFVTWMIECFFKGRFDAKILCLPAKQNIYMLYNILKQDDFETDIVEVLRERVEDAKSILSGIDRQSIDEIFMFFDYDAHNDNLKMHGAHENSVDIMNTLLNVFDNETENGKLYISYPMVEALYDYKEGTCEAFSKCTLSLDTLGLYKRMSGSNNPKASKHLQYLEWREILSVFIMRLMCLLDVDNISFEYYREKITPKTIFEHEYKLESTLEEVFVISAFPEFLLDYFKVDFWNSNVKIKNVTCESGLKKNISNLFLLE